MISAPAGYGKTLLLKKVKSVISNDYLCYFFELLPRRLTTIKTIADKFLDLLEEKQKYSILKYDINKIGIEIGKKIIDIIGSKGEKDKVLIIFDRLEHLDKNKIEPFLHKFLPGIIGAFNDLEHPIKLRFILSGRNIANWKHKSSDYLPLTLEPLTPFDYDSIYQTVKNYNDSQLIQKSPDYIKQFAIKLAIFSGGHPRCMADILSSGDFGDPIRDIENNKDKYFDEYIKPTIEKIEEEIPKELKDIFYKLSPIRRFDLELLEYLINTEYITWKDTAQTLENKLRDTTLVQDDHGFSKDEITRRLFAIKFRKEDRVHYENIINNVIKFFKGKLKEKKLFKIDIISLEILLLELELSLVKGRNFQNFEETFSNILNYLNRLSKINKDRKIIPSFKQELEKDWEIKLLFKYIFPDKSFEELLNRSTYQSK